MTPANDNPQEKALLQDVLKNIGTQGDGAALIKAIIRFHDDNDALSQLNVGAAQRRKTANGAFDHASYIAIAKALIEHDPSPTQATRAKGTALSYLHHLNDANIMETAVKKYAAAPEVLLAMSKSMPKTPIADVFNLAVMETVGVTPPAAKIESGPVNATPLKVRKPGT